MKKTLLIILIILTGCVEKEIDPKKAQIDTEKSTNKYIYFNEYDEFTEDIVQGLMTRERMDTNGILLYNYTIKPHKKKYKLKAEIVINDGSKTIVDLFDIEANDKDETLLYCSDRYILKAALTDDESILVYNEYNVNELIGYQIYFTFKEPHKSELYKLANNEILVNDWTYLVTTREIFDSDDEYEADNLSVKIKLEVIE